MKQLLLEIVLFLDLPFLGQTIAALMVTLLLSGAIGLEREHVHRPAGVRTHLLVGLSSCLVMLTSEFLLRKYQGNITIDITRLSAQVLSGIGFIGAGTIIKEGYNVKGLTTAASLWSVACIGIACGSGFYIGAILLTTMILSALAYMKNRLRSTTTIYLKVVITNVDNTLFSIESLLSDYHLFVHNIEIIPLVEEQQHMVKFKLSLPPQLNSIYFILQTIEKMDGIKSASIE